MKQENIIELKNITKQYEDNIVLKDLNLDIKKNDTNSYYKISVLLKDLGRNDEAVEMLRTLLKTKPDMASGCIQ